MRRYALTIAYDGTDFNGWQKQADEAGLEASRALRSVQHTVEQAVISAVREPVSLLGASRTDAGVHARAQLATFATSDDRRGASDERLALAINSRLPDDVLVTQCRLAHPDFHPIAHCISKGYRYSIHASSDRPLWNRKFVAHVHHRLDIDAMRRAAEAIEGVHDFAGFAAAKQGRLSTVRTVLECRVTPLEAPLVVIDVSGDGFLHNMVRIIAGTLIEVGKGKLSMERVRRALDECDRRAAGPTAPASGLCLEWIKYPEEAFQPGAPAVPATRKAWEDALAREAMEQTE